MLICVECEKKFYNLGCQFYAICMTVISLLLQTVRNRISTILVSAFIELD